MRGLLSLDQELRAVRNGSRSKDANRSNHIREPREAEQPWKQDIEQIQQTMREVLRAIASLSGVELPGLPPGLEDDKALLPPLDIRTLKDRFRNELEAFSMKTTEELSKRARQQAQAALDAVQNELMDGRIDQVASDLREKLQSPAQIEKFVEPAVKEAVASLERSFSQKVEQLFAEQQKLVQNKLQGALSSVQAQVSTQVDAELRVKLQPQADIEKLVEPRVGEAAARLETSISQKVDHLFAEQQKLVQDKLQGALSSVQAQVSTLEQTVQQIREQKAASVGQLSAEPLASTIEKSLSKKVENLFAEQEHFVQDRLQGMLSPIQAQISTLEQALQQIRLQQANSLAQLSTERSNANVEKSLSERVDHLFAQQEQSVQDKLQRTLSFVQTQVSTLQHTVQQVRLQQADSLAQLSAERSNATIEKSLSEKVERLFAQQEQMVQGRLQGTLGTIQVQISKLEKTVQALRADSLAQLSAERLNAADNSTMKYEIGVNNGLAGGLDQAAKRVESSFNKLLETFKSQPVQSTVGRPQEKPAEVLFEDPVMNLRVQQAMDYLDRLGSKSPQPVS